MCRCPSPCLAPQQNGFLHQPLQSAAGGGRSTLPSAGLPSLRVRGNNNVLRSTRRRSGTQDGLGAEEAAGGGRPWALSVICPENHRAGAGFSPSAAGGTRRAPLPGLGLGTSSEGAEQRRLSPSSTWGSSIGEGRNGERGEPLVATS